MYKTQQMPLSQTLGDSGEKNLFEERNLAEPGAAQMWLLLHMKCPKGINKVSVIIKHRSMK